LKGTDIMMNRQAKTIKEKESELMNTAREPRTKNGE
jgi:hypothetical protein